MSEHIITAENLSDFKKNYELCKQYMFYANRELRCNHPNCPIGGCLTTFTPDLQQSVGQVGIPCELIEGFNESEVVWDSQEKVGDRRSPSVADNKWYIDVVEDENWSQKNDPTQPKFKLRAITEEQAMEKARAEIEKRKQEENQRIKDGGECSFVSLRESHGTIGDIPGAKVNHHMPHQPNMREVIRNNIQCMNLALARKLRYMCSNPMLIANELKENGLFQNAKSQLEILSNQTDFNATSGDNKDNLVSVESSNSYAKSADSSKSDVGENARDNESKPVSIELSGPSTLPNVEDYLTYITNRGESAESFEFKKCPNKLVSTKSYTCITFNQSDDKNSFGDVIKTPLSVESHKSLKHCNGNKGSDNKETSGLTKLSDVKNRCDDRN